MPETLVSIVVPCYNEQATIGLLLQAIHDQTFPRRQMEVIIADGGSTDRTKQVVAAFQAVHPDLPIHWIENPRRIIPAALNLAIAKASGEWVIRLDAHSVPQQDYVSRCLAALLAGKGDNVGGVWDIQPGREGWIARSIAAAAAHPMGVGDARYRFSTQPGLVDTVPFGAVRRRLFTEIGGYDESLPINEDYEFNARLRQSGGKVFLDPSIRTVYYARADLPALARQYFRYGYWKFRMLQRYPGTLRWRQALPPVFVLGTSLMALLAPFHALIRRLLLIGLGLYAGVLVAGAVPSALRMRDPASTAGIPAAIATMHFSWGTGFWVSVIRWLGKVE